MTVPIDLNHLLNRLDSVYQEFAPTLVDSDAGRFEPDHVALARGRAALSTLFAELVAVESWCGT